MTTDQKRNQIEENYINGNISDARAIFKKMSKKDRADFASDRALSLAYANDEKTKSKRMNFADFLIKSI